MSATLALLRTLRPHQWVKNVFVAAALVFSRHLTEVAYVGRTLLAMLAFCALSGAVYAFNDVRDVDADREHPTKRHRPIASGALSPRTALVWAVSLAFGSLAACTLLSPWLALCGALYLAQNIAYSVRLKHVAFVDVGLIASGFMLRVLAGASAIAVPVSGWLLVCTALIATLLGFGKRAHELAWAERHGKASVTRAALAGYRLSHLRVAMYVLAITTTAAYVGYTLDPHTAAMFGTTRLVWSAPFVAIGLARFLVLALQSRDESPTEAMLLDPLCIADAIAAVGTVLIAIYA